VHTELTGAFSSAALGEVPFGRLVGEGSAAWVYRARDGVGLKLSREVGKAAEARLAREAIARAVCGEAGGPLDAGFVDIGGTPHPVLAFRWIEGTPLDLFDERSDELMPTIARDIGAALARLHRLGWRHGDVKPENIVVASRDGTLHASPVDLSLAAPFAEPLAGGTIAYLAPELLAGGKREVVLGAEADVFALGRTLEVTARRLSLASPLDENAKLAASARPGDRPSAAALAGWSSTSMPLDAAYVLTRLPEIERAAREGHAPPEGPARRFTEGLFRALAGLARRVANGAPMPPLDAKGLRALLAVVAGESARTWPLPPRLSNERALLEALERAGDALSPRDLLEEVPLVAETTLPRALAAVALNPDDDRAIEALARAASAYDGSDLDSARTAITLLRRADRIAEARTLALAARAQTDAVDVVIDAADLARLSGDRKDAAALLDALLPGSANGANPRVVALRARVAIDDGDASLADSLLDRVSNVPSSEEPSLAEVRALRAWAQGHYDEGIAEIDAVASSDAERRARLLLVRGMLLLGRGDAASAHRDFGRAADLALALSSPSLEASARASAAAAAHDAGLLGPALEASTRAIALLERTTSRKRENDLATARLSRAASLVSLGAQTEAIAEARRARQGSARTRAYARWMEIEASEPSEALCTLAKEAEADLGTSPADGDRLQALSYRALAGEVLAPQEIAEADRLATDVEPAYARWTWLRARLSMGAPHAEFALDRVLRASDGEAPPSVVGPVLALALAESRRAGKGDQTRALHERLVRLVDRLDRDVPLAHRAAFDALRWVSASRMVDSERGADVLGLGAGQIELLAAIARGLRDRTSLSDLLRQVVDGLVLWVGVERGLLLLRAPGGERLVPRVARGLSREDLRGEQLALSSSLAARALATLEPVVAVDASGESEGDMASSIHALRLRSVLAVPLVARGEALGVVYLDDRVRRGAFGPREIAWVRLLSTQAAAAIADARDALRLRRLARRAERAESRLEEQLAKTEGALEIARAELAQIRPDDERDPRGTRHRYDALIGDGPAMRKMLSIVDRVTDAADARIPVLVVGESGTGKELVARAIHENGSRRGRPFVAENCGAIPEPLLESTLFGHVRGAFTGADRTRVGLFEVATGGTLLLDEIGEMGAAMQAKLLRVLQEREVRPVGGEKSTKVDVRVIGATHRNLEQMVREGKFREDLYYRLAVVTIDVPPLRERAEDLPALVEHLLRRFAAGRDVKVTRRALGALAAARWPGNVRQLENEIRRALVLCDDTLDLEHLSPELFNLQAKGGKGEAALGLSLREQIDALELRLVTEALRRSSGNQTHAARALGLSRFGLQKMLKRLGLGAKG